MRRLAFSALSQRQESLLQARDAARAESARLEREEQYLVGQLRRAEEQLRYYNGLLSSLRKDWGKRGTLTDLVQRLD